MMEPATPTQFFADQIVMKERRPELDIWTATVHPGSEPPMHVHRREDEWIHVLRGQITVFADGSESSLGAGGFCHLPARA